jgi:amidase
MSYIDELDKLDGIGIKELLDQNQLSTVEVVKHYIEKIKALNPDLNAVIYTMFDEALRKAEEGSYVQNSPFSGMPTLIKELNDIKGHPATQGSRLLKGNIAKEDDVIVNRLRKAGLLFLGKTNSPEFGFLPTTEPELFGPTKNPWNFERSPGGSSGGAGAAVASGMAPFAQGSDGGGSIRIPASTCGLFGLKPSRGRMPYSDYMNQLSVNHALTRSVRDSAALLDVLSGKGEFDTFPSFNHSEPFLEAIKKQPNKLKVAITTSWNGQAFIDKETQKAVNHTGKLLEALGHDVYDASPKFQFDQFSEDFITVWAASGSIVIKHLGQLAGTEPTVDNLERLSYNLFREGENLTATQYEEARVSLQREARKLLAFHQEYDVLLTPVLNKQPVCLGQLKDQHDPIHDMLDNFTNYCSFTPIANVTGQPSMSLPLYWSEEGFPIGTMLTGRLGDETTLLKLAKQLEEANPWFHHYDELTKRIELNTISTDTL